MAQLSELEVLVKRYGFDDDDPVVGAINMGMFDLVNEANWNWLEAYSTSVTMGASDSTLQGLPSSVTLGRVISLRVTTTGGWKLEEYSPLRFDLEVENPSERGIPRLYVPFANMLTVWPLADRDLTFSLRYELLVSKLVNPTDVPMDGMMPEAAQYCIVPKAAATLLQMENEEERAANALLEYNDKVEKLYDKYTDRALDFDSQVMDTQGYGD